MANLALRVTNMAAGQVVKLETSSLPSGVVALMAQASAGASGAGVAITTVGAGVLTAAAMLSGLITRSGPTAAFTDTTSTAALLQAAWGATTNASFNFTIKNTTAFPETIAAGVGVTLAGQTIIPANSNGTFQVVWTGANAVTITGVAVTAQNGLPQTKTTALNATTGSLPAGAATGANWCFINSSNATPGAQLVRTAAQMLADTPNGQVGMNWMVRVINSGAGTFTLTTDAGATVTLTGTMTVPTNTFRDFQFVLTGAATATAQSQGAGTI